MRRANQFTFEIVSPAMQRADNIVRMATTTEHFCLTMAADIRHQFDALRITNENAAFVFPGERCVVAHIGDHQLMAGVLRALLEKLLFFFVQQSVIEINAYRKLRCRPREFCETGQIGHPHPQINFHQPKRERIRKNLFNRKRTVLFWTRAGLYPRAQSRWGIRKNQTFW